MVKTMRHIIRLILPLNVISLFLFNLVFSQTYNVSIPVITVEETQTQVTIPIIVAEDLSGQNITAYQGQIKWDNSVIQYSDYDYTGTLSEPWSGAGWVDNASPGSLIFGQYHTTSLSGSGTIINLIFNVVGNLGDISNIAFDHFILNSAVANTTNGQVKIGNVVNQTISIAPSKLNLISFNVSPDNITIQTMLDDLETLLITSDDDGKFYIPPYQVNTIGDVDFSNGYKIFITENNADDVINQGIPLNPQSLAHTFTNTKKFSIGYPYQNSFPVVDVFAAISSNVVIVQDDEGRFWIPSYAVNTIGNMLPGKGYDIFVDQAINFTYPDLSGGLAKIKTMVAELPEPEHFQFEKTGLPYAVVITNSEETLCLLDEIGIFAKNICVGAGIYGGTYPMIIAAWEGNEKYNLPGFKKGEKIKFKVRKCDSGEELKMEGSFSNNDESVFGESPFSVVSLNKRFVPQVEKPKNFVLGFNYPNPFNSTTCIKYQLTEDSFVVLKIYNLMGQEIKTLVDGFKTAASYSILWNGKDNYGKDVVSGIYLYKIQAGDYACSKKMAVVR